jgi:tRNA(Ile)-lysidine synthase
MKRKNLIATKKVSKKKLLFEDKKIQNLYKKFKSIIYKNIKNKNFAVGVSGGSDSLCLAYLSKIYSSQLGSKNHILIVDHGLRQESAKEALKVKNILKNKNLNSHILKWKKNTPLSNIQKNARDIRYSLISDYCLKKEVKYLVTAHHEDDQIENFLIRLVRGSGLTGLASMPIKTNYNNKLKIIRPLLKFKKQDLKYITLSYFDTYIKDPSNNDDKFLRVRIRKYRKSMEKEGLDTRKIIKTADNLFSANEALNYYKNKSLHNHTSFLSKNKCLINKKIFTDEAGEIVFKSFSDILTLVSGTYYPPRSKKIINLITRLKSDNFNKSTLGGCTIEYKDNFILVSKELKISKKIKKTSYQPRK